MEMPDLVIAAGKKQADAQIINPCSDIFGI
jgi:hypothetical protein